MGELATRFGGKISGELIRADDWNGLIEGIETQLTGLETRLNGRIAALEPRLAAAEASLAAIAQSLAAVTQSLAPLQALAASLRDRQRRIDLKATRTTFAVGERAEIVARVSDLLGAPLNLANEAARPWIDFVTVWGTLKAAPGFASVAGTGGRTVTVRVNAEGEAKVLLRAEAGEEFAEEQELEVAAVLGTKVGAKSVAAAFLDSPTPGSTDLTAAYAAVTSAYQRADTAVVRNYIDTTYLAKPARAYTPMTKAFAINWRDEHATVLAFMKPDDNPESPDSAMAVGSIRVTFRDWVYPWIMTQFLPVQPAIVAAYKDEFGPKISKGKRMDAAASDIWDVIEKRTKNRGILGQQREFAAAQDALSSLAVADPPSYFPGLMQSVGSSLAVQRSLAFGQAVAPMVVEDVAPARGLSRESVRGESAATSAVEGVNAETLKFVAAAEARIMSRVAAETTKITNDLLKEDGPVRKAETLARSAKSDVEKVNIELGRKAPLETVNQILGAQIMGGRTR
jgi:hypothetical protein